jgi:hypothetical protein
VPIRSGKRDFSGAHCERKDYALATVIGGLKLKHPYRVSKSGPFVTFGLSCSMVRIRTGRIGYVLKVHLDLSWRSMYSRPLQLRLHRNSAPEKSIRPPLSSERFQRERSTTTMPKRERRSSPPTSSTENVETSAKAERMARCSNPRGLVDRPCIRSKVREVRL